MAGDLKASQRVVMTLRLREEIAIILPDGFMHGIFRLLNKKSPDLLNVVLLETVDEMADCDAPRISILQEKRIIPDCT
jgi:hypothetical protein